MMQVDKIQLWSNNRQICEFSLNGENLQSPYILKGSTGLDAEQITARYYGEGLETRTKWYDLSLSPREVSLKIGLNPNYGLGDRPIGLRDTLYKAIASNRNGMVKLKFMYDGACVGVLNGLVTKLEADLHAKATDVQLTMRCQDPLIKAETKTTLDVATLDTESFTITDLVSSAPHGLFMKFEVAQLVPTTFMSIRDAETDYEWEFRFDNAVVDNDMFYLSSENGNRFFYKLPNDLPIGQEHLMGYLQVGSSWPYIFYGDNPFFIEIAGFTFTWAEVSYYETHWGI